METLKRKCLKAWPYFLCVLAGCVLFGISLIMKGDFKNLILGIAGSFFAIPCLYLIYELALQSSRKALNKELIDYAKLQVDGVILSILKQLTKIVYPYEKQDFSFQAIQQFLSQNKEQIQESIEHSNYLGFQVFGNWSISERNLHHIIQNPFMLERLEDEQSISIIKILKALRSLEAFQENSTQLYTRTKRKTSEYKIKSGKEVSKKNLEYPDRYLLLKHMTEDNYQVVDFGDFAPYQLEKLLSIYNLNKKYIAVYAEEINNMMQQINRWLDLTGKEFLIDTKMFRLGLSATKKQEIQEKAIRI